MDFFSINNMLVYIPLGNGGYHLSWIEATGTLAGLLCIWLVSLEKSINYLFGLINVTLFAIIFFQIQLYSSLLLQIFFFMANLYGWYAWSHQPADATRRLHIRCLPRVQAIFWGVAAVITILLLTFTIDPVFAVLTEITLNLLSLTGLSVTAPQLQPDAYPFWDACITVLSVIAMILMTRKYTENWILWVIINLISVAIFTLQGVYAMSLEYLILTIIAINGTRLWMRKANRR